MKLFILMITMFMMACAPSNQPHQSTEWNMTYNCNGNRNCASNMGAWSGSGSFSNESDCLAWETGFLNINYGSPVQTVTACTGN